MCSLIDIKLSKFIDNNNLVWTDTFLTVIKNSLSLKRYLMIA